MGIDATIYKSAINNARRGQIKSLAQKLDQNPEIAIFKDDYGDSPLIREAVAADQETVVDLLLLRRAFPLRPDGQPDLDSSLSLAIARGNLPIVLRLIEAGADVNARVAPDMGLLQDLCVNTINYPDRYMLAMNEAWRTRIEALREATQDIFFCLVEHGAVIDEPYKTLSYAAGGGLARVVRHLLREVIAVYPEPAETRPTTTFRAASKRLFSQSAIAQAVRHGQREIFQWLFALGGIDGNGGEDGRDALYCAVCENLPEIAHQLLGAGVSADIGLYSREADTIPAYATITEMAQALYQANRTNVYFDKDIDPESFVARLSAAISAFPAEVYPLVNLAQFNFLHSLVREIQVAIAVDPDQRATLVRRQDESAVGHGDAEQEVEETFAELLAAREGVVATAMERGSPAVREMRPLGSVLQDLEAAMGEVDRRALSSLFGRGLTKRKIATVCKKLKAPLPEDLITLYTWRDGAASDADKFFHGYRFMPLECAVTIFGELRSMYSSAFFPLMNDVFGSMVQFDLRPDHHAGMVYETDVDAFDQPVVYPNLSGYFAALAACFREGIFRIGRNAGGEAVLVGHGDRMDVVFRRYALRLPDAADDEPEIEVEAEEGIAGRSVYDYTVPLRGNG